jgi:hypothetical protein
MPLTDMMLPMRSRIQTTFIGTPVGLVLLWIVGTLLLPTRLGAQWLGREALSTFPADTQQLAYLNLSQLRSMAEYPQMRNYLLNRQFRDFQDFLRSLGVDSEKDVNEVILGWRGVGTDRPGMMGRAEGRFDAEKVRRQMVRMQMPVREYQGYELYTFGSGEDPTDIVFVFLSASSAAFGKMRDLKELLDVKMGAKPALESNTAIVAWEAELEGTSPQWGLSVGKAASLQAGPWLAAGGKDVPDISKVFGPVEAVLYRMDWGGGVTTHASIICQNDESASTLAQMLAILKTARGSGVPEGFLTVLQGTDVQASGPRVELTTSVPFSVIEQMIRGSARF